MENKKNLYEEVVKIGRVASLIPMFSGLVIGAFGPATETVPAFLVAGACALVAGLAKDRSIKENEISYKKENPFSKFLITGVRAVSAAVGATAVTGLTVVGAAVAVVCVGTVGALAIAPFAAIATGAPTGLAISLATAEVLIGGMYAVDKIKEMFNKKKECTNDNSGVDKSCVLDKIAKIREEKSKDVSISNHIKPAL